MREISDKSDRSDRPGPAPRFSPKPWVWLAWVWLVAATLSCSRPEATVPATSPRPPTDRDVIAEWLAEIPAACLAQTPIVPVSCPAPVPDPAGACIVEQRDLAGGRMTDRWVFDQGRLLRVESIVSDVQKSTRTYEYDAHGRVVSDTACMTSTGGEPAWYPAWREPLVRYDSPTTIVTRTDRTYAPGSNVPVFGRMTWTTAFEGKVVSQEMKLCYRFDAGGRRLARYQVYRMNDRPRALDTEVRTYEYKNAQLERTTFSTLNLDLQPEPPGRGKAPKYTIRFKNAWHADFSYDGYGRIIGFESAGSKMTLEYGTHGRLVRYGSLTLEWDSGDHLVSMKQGGPTFDREYLYHDDGRFLGATYADGAGYRMLYLPGCPDGFVNAAFQPSIDNFLYYEGKDQL
ncbi:hypothetical protein KJ975_10750 [Myxococcota bacterium]|nr:hypothetical protein [Myxococcota bacterium]